jgi:hypothetical protein
VHLLHYVNVGLAVALFLGMVLLQEVGFRVGRRTKISDTSRAGTGLIEAAVFALLGLLLAFQFTQAGSRLDYRRGLVVKEANAIGTAYLRLNLLNADRQPHLRDLFRHYTDTRIRVWEKVPDLKAAEAEEAAARQLQSEIWSRAAAAAQAAPTTAPAILLLPALNAMIDVTTSRNVAARTHAPGLVVFLLFNVALLSALLAGYAMSAANRRNWLHVVVFAAVVAITVFVILDLEYPRVGLIRIGAADRALVELRQSMN